MTIRSWPTLLRISGSHAYRQTRLAPFLVTRLIHFPLEWTFLERNGLPHYPRKPRVVTTNPGDYT